MSRSWPPLLALVAACVVAWPGRGFGQKAPEAGSKPDAPTGDDPWCAPELTTLEGSVCAREPSREADGPRTLAIFLHGVLKPDAGWQWGQQRAGARAASTHGFTAIMPRGRRGGGSAGMEDFWRWPGGGGETEIAILAEWARAKVLLEEKSGKPFERVWIFGFSSGAYYATSLALRGLLSTSSGALRADGFAAFAGGSGAAYLERSAGNVAIRAPLFVAWGGKDKAHPDQVKLARMLRRLRWPTASEGAPRAGHTMTDHALASAVRFLGETKPVARPRSRR